MRKLSCLLVFAICWSAGIAAVQPQSGAFAAKRYRNLFDLHGRKAGCPNWPSPLPMIASEHDNLTPQKGRTCPARRREMLDFLVKAGEYKP